MVKEVGEYVDTLINIDVRGRGVVDVLYHHVRERLGESLTSTSAKALIEAVKPGDTVIIATGFLLPPTYLRIGETDGPLGAAALARAVVEAFDAVPIIICERELKTPMEAVVGAVGLSTTGFENAKRANREGWPHVAVVWDFPDDVEQAKLKSSEVIKKAEPSAIVAVEKASMNEKGVYHSSKGLDISNGMAKLDYLINEARAQNIITIGIGDGGNEIGFGLVREAIKEHIPYGAKCQCPCGAGIISATATDKVVTAGVSNWGAYGMAACLAAMLKKPGILHTGDMEQRVLEASVNAGFVDGTTRRRILQVDVLPAETHIHIVELLRMLIMRRLQG